MSLRKETAAVPTAPETNGPDAGEGSWLPGAWGWFASLLLAAALVTGIWHYWTPGEWLVEEWREALEDAPEAEIATRLHQISEVGDAGIDALVDSLGSPRAIVAEGARRELGDLLDRWELLPAADSTAKIAALVHAMNGRATKWNAAPLRPAAELAHRALRWRLDAKSPVAMQIVAGCEAVLRASAAANRSTAAPVSLAAFSDDNTHGNPREAAWDGAGGSEVLNAAAFDDPRHPPSADLPLDIFPLPAAPPWPATDARGEKPTNAADASTSPVGEPALLAPLPGRPVPLEAAGSKGEADAVANRPRATAQSAEFTRLLGVMRNLHAADRQAAAQAEAELRRAGFDELRLEIARRITDPDPAKRRDLAEQLPRVQNLDARPWLLALTQDDDASVASAARQVLATSSDPALQSAARDGMKR